jgi:acetyl esterase
MIDSEVEIFLGDWKKAWAAAPVDMAIAMRRQILEKIAEDSRPPLPKGYETFELTVDGKRSVRVRIFRPIQEGPTPAFIFMHGGSWMIGSSETHFQLAATIAELCGHMVVSVNYALAPESPWPAAFEDCEAVVNWVFANAEMLKIVPSEINIGGESAGANLAAAIAQRFRDTPQQLRKQLLFYPPVDFTFTSESFIANANAPMLTTANMIEAVEAYVPNLRDRKNPFAAPLQAADFSRLPSAFIAVAEHDPLHDDGVEYARRLTAAGVPTTVHTGRGLVHGYLRALSYATQAREALATACNWLAGPDGRLLI